MPGLPNRRQLTRVRGVRRHMTADVSCHCTAQKTHQKSPVVVYETRYPGCRKTCIDCCDEVKFIDQEKGYPERCPRCSRRHAYASKGTSSWNKGLTKDNDERMSISAANMRAHYREHGHHNSGKTKENDEGVRQKAAKSATACRNTMQRTAAGRLD